MTKMREDIPPSQTWEDAMYRTALDLVVKRETLEKVKRGVSSGYTGYPGYTPADQEEKERAFKEHRDALVAMVQLCQDQFRKG